jgi:hypothetical protein
MAIDWQQMFALSVSPLELIIRGSLIYCFLFLIFRVILRRDVGAIGIADVVVLVLIADAASNAMSGEYKSITDGVILVSTIVAWNVLLDWLSFRSPPLAGVDPVVGDLPHPRWARAASQSAARVHDRGRPAGQAA